MRKRLLAMVMAICMVAGMLPVSAFAVDCDHHPEHTAECGYVEAVAGAPCTHECGADCYSTVDNCTHGDNHDADCGWAAATEETAEVPCAHVCGEACKTQVQNCIHGDNHDEACGYIAAVEGVACKFVCNTCSGTNPATEGGEDDDPVCTGDETCTLTEGHNEGCPKAEPVCTKDENCVYTGTHQEGCPKAETTGETKVCTEADGCEATEHKVTCPKYVWPCDKTDDCKAATHEESCPKYVWTCDKTDDCKATTHDEGCPLYMAPCTHTYSPWDWYEDTANPDNNTFARSCTLCQAEERNYMPEEVLQIMNATPEDAQATKAALEQAVADGVLTQGAAQMLIDTLGIMPTVNVATISGVGYPTLADAMAAVGAGGTAVIELADGTHTLPAGNPTGRNWKTLDVTFKGSKDAIIDIPNIVYNDGGKFTFDGVTVNFPATGDYYGIAHIGEIIYSNCFINGKQTLYAATSAFNNCVFNNKSDYCVWTWGATSVTFSGCTFNTGGKAVLVYGGGPTNVILTGCVFKSEKTLNKAAVETGNDYGATYTVTINNCSADSGFVLNKSTSPLWGNKNEMDHEHLIVKLDGKEVTAPYVDMSGITLNNKVYDGNMLSYTGKATIRTYRVELKDANGDAYDFTYEWYEKKSDGTYEKISGNVAPKEIGEYKLVATTSANVFHLYENSGEILVKIEKTPAPSTGTNTNTNTIYIYSETKLLQTGSEAMPVGLMAFGGVSLLAVSMWLLRKKYYEW